VAGPLLGSVVLTVLPEFLTALTDYRLILYGSLLMVSIYWLPQGLVGRWRCGAKGRRGEGGRGEGEQRRRGAGARDPERQVEPQRDPAEAEEQGAGAKRRRGEAAWGRREAGRCCSRSKARAWPSVASPPWQMSRWRFR